MSQNVQIGQLMASIQMSGSAPHWDGGEIDVAESDMGTGNCTYVNFVIHDTCGTCNSINIYWPQTVQLADAFHTYGFYWH